MQPFCRRRCLGGLVYGCCRTGPCEGGRARLEPLGLGRGQPSILAALWYWEGVSQSELAETLYLDKGCVARSVRRLEQAGYMERRRSERDRRVVRLYLTERGRGVHDRLFSALASWTDILAADFSAEERRLALSLLRRMRANAARGMHAGDSAVTRPGADFEEDAKKDANA